MPVLTQAAEEKTRVEEVKESFRLARFVAALAVDSQRLQGFIAEPEEEMAAADLTAKEKSFLREEGFKNLCDYLWEVGPKPTPPDPQPPPAGG